MPLFFGDPYFFLAIIGLIISLLAQLNVSATFARYKRLATYAGLTGGEVARRLLHEKGIYDVVVEETPFHLGDHYDPSAKVLRLSPEVYRGTSIAALGVAAHEVGHAIQHHEGYVPLNLRAAVYPIVNIGSHLYFPLILLGFIFRSLNLIYLGIFAFLAILFFQLITLPVEFNASRRALALLEGGGYLVGEEMAGARRVLQAAALTYVAAVAVSMLELFRLLAIAGLFGRRDD